MKRFVYWAMLLVLLLPLVLGACGATEPPPEPTEEPAEPVVEPTKAPEPVEPEPEGGCPASTVADNMGYEGKFPYQFELSEYESLAGCTMTFSENPDIADLNARITNNPDLPPLEERLPEEPLVIQPYDAIGKYGGQLDGLSNNTEAGTSDLLAIRHVLFFRFSDDLVKIVPMVAKSWEWNEDLTELTIHLRKGHKWSDGQPFTAEDVVFWYNDIVLNPDIFEVAPTKWLFGGEPAEVTAPDETTVVWKFAVPSPGIVARFAVDFAQPFLPKHFFEQFHIKYNPDADALAQEQGFESWVDLVNLYYGSSDWKDVPSPLLSGASDFVMPTLESHILVEESTTGRHLVANPYFFIVDTQGNQLPYINEIDELYIPDDEVRNLKISNGEVDYKAQAVFVENFSLYKENEANGNYTVDLANGVGENTFYGFNLNHKDEGLREIFGDIRFRKALSLAINRDEIVEIVYLGQAEPMQATPADANTVEFVTEDHLTSFIDYDPDAANALLDEMGLVDTDGDGFRERLDGSNFTILLQFSNQGAPGKMHELVKTYWDAVGVRAEIKEVSSDEYRDNGSAGDLDVTVWKYDGTSGPAIVQNTEMTLPPFGGPFNPGQAYMWADWMSTDGAQGIEPPADVLRLYDVVDEFMQYPLGSEDSNRLGEELVSIHVDNLWKIGIAGNIKTPVVHHNTLKNWGPYPVKTYDYYWCYPYRPFQWFFEE